MHLAPALFFATRRGGQRTSFARPEATDGGTRDAAHEIPAPPRRCLAARAIDDGVEAFVIKRHDSFPALEATLTDESGNAVNVSGLPVQFVMSTTVGAAPSAASPRRTHVPGDVVFSKAGVVQDGPAGVVRYDWSSGDTGDTGYYFGEFKITFPGGRVRSFPTVGYIPIRITPDLS